MKAVKQTSKQKSNVSSKQKTINALRTLKNELSADNRVEKPDFGQDTPWNPLEGEDLVQRWKQAGKQYFNEFGDWGWYLGHAKSIRDGYIRGSERETPPSIVQHLYTWEIVDENNLRVAAGTCPECRKGTSKKTGNEYNIPYAMTEREMDELLKATKGHTIKFRSRETMRTIATNPDLNKEQILKIFASDELVVDRWNSCGWNGEGGETEEAFFAMA